MNLPLYVVDAFTDQVFHGNPAAICPLDQWLPDHTMQSIAAENNLAETAFLVPEGNGWRLRWFTPLVEIELCGHATLASALVLTILHPQQQEFHFHTLSGELVVTRQKQQFTLDFPARPLELLASCAGLEAALGCKVLTITKAAKTLIAELPDQAAIVACTPDFAALKALPCSGVIITAQGEHCDFVSRFFAPKVGINEDPVTGSAHCGLTPYWAARLGRTQLQARQLSARGGDIRCELRGSRVLMTGTGVLYSQGTIWLEQTW